MSAKILQVVNSGFFGISQSATSVAQAVGYLGTDVIKTLALQSETFRAFVPTAGIPTSFWKRMQRHSQHSAIIAGTLPIAREIREATVVAALLHDAGIFALASTMPDQFTLVLDEVERRKCTQVEAEEALFGISHAEVGAYLLGLWGMRSLGVEAIAHHHHPSRIRHEGLDCSLAVYLSNLIAHDVEGNLDDPDREGLSVADRMELKELGLLDQYPSFKSKAMQVLSMQRVENGPACYETAARIPCEVAAP
jgi:HD-like signal output (HDOD) protein